jgi:MinD superfamily P-loop ATPase
MIVSVASGKGGTGKTTIAVNLALSVQNVQLMDCDVEEPNAHIFLKPEIREVRKATIPVPQIDESLCDFCGKCRELCAYNAIAVLKLDEGKGNVLVFPHLCHGCGGCTLICPKGAVKEVAKEIGVVEKGNAGGLEFVQGRLNVGEIMSPPLIKQVRQLTDSGKTVIIDAPPGTSCPVVAAVRNTDFCILVTEPTPFGLNDLILAVEVLRKLEIPHGVVINRSDIGDDQVDRYCGEQKIPILMRIPFDREIAALYSQGTPLVMEKLGYREQFGEMFERIRRMVQATNQ